MKLDSSAWLPLPSGCVNLHYNHKLLFFCVCEICKSGLKRFEPTAKKSTEKNTIVLTRKLMFY